ncbi:right-handed parallel beta-helix repeat-containing protein [Roseimarinus sediminis]|uniref:right-handed parallel beta-helix repeat-containing protein n=1 Tax=Roseimarinus sediminis TaxID=1610899 RepID=UPI003D1CD494
MIARLPYLVLLFLLILSSCRPDKVNLLSEDWEYLCTAETLNKEGDHFTDAYHPSILFRNTVARSDEQAKEGAYSVKLTKDRPFGFTIQFPQCSPDEFFRLTVWRKSTNDKGVIVASTNDGFYVASDKVYERADNGWEKLILEFFAPANLKENISAYVWNNGADSVYFDNFYIERKTERDYPEYSIDSALKLYYDEQAQRSIDATRYRAFEEGTLIVGDDDYVESLFFADDDYYEAKIRLKGDWLDHVQGDKLSFRIKTKTDYAWRGMKSFSVQTPPTRNFQHEWVLHQMLFNHDMLTTRYGFIPLYKNGKSNGIYAWEEHFDKQLIESSNRREGPIVRFDESLFWLTNNLNHNDSDTGYDIPFFEGAMITAFKQNSILGDPLLKREFIEAQALMHQFQYRKAEVSSIFDVDKLAAFFAINVLNQAHHGLAWHNIRFYYNPVLCRLEPITYDGGYYEGTPFAYEPYLSTFEEVSGPIRSYDAIQFWPFRDRLFMKHYVEWMSKVGSENFVRSQLATMEETLRYDEKQLQKEFPYYHYNPDHLFSFADSISRYLPQLKEAVADSSFYRRTRSVDYHPMHRNKKYNDQLVVRMVNLYLDRSSDGRYFLEVENFFGDEIELRSGKMSSDIFDNAFEKPLRVAPFAEPYQATRFEIDQPYNEISVHFPEAGKTILLPVNPWPAPRSISSRQQVEATVKFPQTDFYTVKNKQLIFEGRVNINRHVIIPAGYQVVVKAGASINITDSATFVSYSPLYVEGTIERPVLIHSEDHSARGFNIFQAGERSQLKHVTFSTLSNLNFGGWFTPAAVCFYEADVDMEEVTFMNNIACDDALNVVRSDFFVERCKFTDTFADAFDSDFCTGTVTRCEFTRPGNDGIDFSGSQILIDQCIITDAVDKGVSGGEGSTLRVTNTSISGANIAIASKDRSKVIVNNCKVNGNVYGMSAYVKKPEYGAARIEVNNTDFKDNMFLHLIEEQSVLLFNNKTIKGSARKVAERFY